MKYIKYYNINVHRFGESTPKEAVGILVNRVRGNYEP